MGVACRTLCPVLDVSPQTFLASYHYLNVDKLANAVPNFDPNSVISLTSVFNVEVVLVRGKCPTGKGTGVKCSDPGIDSDSKRVRRFNNWRFRACQRFVR